MIGALARQQALLDSSVAGKAQPLLRAAGRFVGYLATRHRGTVGGSLAYAAPWAELTAAVVALDAQLEIRSARGERTVAARSFFRGPNETALEPDELLTAVRIPAAAARDGCRLPRGQRALPGLRAGRAQPRSSRSTRRDRAPRPSSSCSALRRRRIASTSPHLVADSDRRRRRSRRVAESLSRARAADDIEVSGTYRRRVAATLALRALRDAQRAKREQTA